MKHKVTRKTWQRGMTRREFVGGALRRPAWSPARRRFCAAGI